MLEKSWQKGNSIENMEATQIKLFFKYAKTTVLESAAKLLPIEFPSQETFKGSLPLSASGQQP